MFYHLLREDSLETSGTHIRESRRFESMYILQEKPDAHDTYAPTTGRTRQPFTLTPTELDRSHCSREKGLPTQTPARLSDPRVPPGFSPSTALKQWL